MAREAILVRSPVSFKVRCLMFADCCMRYLFGSTLVVCGPCSVPSEVGIHGWYFQDLQCHHVVEDGGDLLTN